MDLDNPPDPPGSPPYPLPGTSVMLLPLKLASENAIQAQFPLILMDTVLSSKLTFFRLWADLKDKKEVSIFYGKTIKNYNISMAIKFIK